MKKIGVLLRRDIYTGGGRIQKIIYSLLKLDKYHIILIDSVNNNSSKLFENDKITNCDPKLLYKKSKYKIVNFFNELQFNLRSSKEINKEKLNYVICHDLGTLLGGVIAKRKNHDLFLIYDSTELALENLKHKRVKCFIYKHIQKFCIPYCDKIIQVDELRGVYLQKQYSLNSDKQILIKNFPNKNFIIPFKKRSSNKKIFRTVYFGGINPFREIDFLISTFNGLGKNFYLDIIGGGKSEYIEHLIKLSTSSKERIKILPPIFQSEISKTLQKYDIGFMFYRPSNLNHLYAAPNKIYEYLFNGLCVISYNLPSIKPIINDNKVGVCIDNINNDTIYNAIKEIYDANYFENITPELINSFIWENQESKLLRLFR